MIEAIVSGLILAVISGLTFLSYKHHNGYKMVSTQLKVLVWFVFVGASGYRFGFTAGKYSDGKEMFFSFNWVIAGFIVCWVFLAILDLLPMLTEGARSDSGD